MAVALTLLAVGAAFLPEQIHTTFDADPAKLVVSWVSFEKVPFLSSIQFGPSPSGPYTLSNGTFFSYENDECPGNSTRSIHTASFDAPEGVPMAYRVSSDGVNFSRFFNITPASRGYPQSLALWGDMGVNCVLPSVPQITKDAQAGLHSWALHYGDTAYNMDDGCGVVGDTFLNAAQTYSTLLPVVYTPGNHEGGPLKQYAEFTYRLSDGQKSLAAASGSNNTRYMLWRVGPATFFSLDPDAWIYPLVYDLAQPQYEWLDAALARVNRSETPWLVAAVHRAMYCTKTTDPECNSEAQTLRYGFFFKTFGIEALLQKYGVDLYFAGHTHHYERTWPVRDGAYTAQDYINPKATIHIQSGIAGVDGNDPFDVPQEDWEAFRDTSFTPSYTRLTFHNDTHASVQQLRAADGSLLDSFTMMQEHHGEF